MHETFDHTADVGLRVRAPDLPTIFDEAGAALFTVIAGDLSSIRRTDEVPFRIESTYYDYLLFDWLSELLFAFESRRLLLAEFDVSLSNMALSATARGETYDPSRHQLEHEVKAITYHGLKLERAGKEWVAEVIVDI